ncbi:protein phosphatase CheZ [Kosakonia sp. S42]|nr:protein phosphatase CheZ [Kosakonia sp. S42]
MGDFRIELLHKLRDNLYQLGLDKTIAEVAGSIPDAHDRLGYVVTLTRDAVGCVLNSVERRNPGRNCWQRAQPVCRYVGKPGLTAR